jgi:hypothetical protein
MEPIDSPTIESSNTEYFEALREQQQIDALLRKGIIFSLFWLAGIGSTYAVICALRAFRIKRNSKYKLRGTLRGLCCLVLGGWGALFFLWVVCTFGMYLAGYDMRRN